MEAWGYSHGGMAVRFELWPMQKAYYTYILTNVHRRLLYTGITSNLKARLLEHYRASDRHFAGKYKTHYLVYYEVFNAPLPAIHREKEIKSWPRQQKGALIATMNPEWKFLNDQFFSQWPPPAGLQLR